MSAEGALAFCSSACLLSVCLLTITPHQNLSEPTRTKSASSLGLLVSSVSLVSLVSNRFDKNDKQTITTKRYPPTVILNEVKDLIRDGTLGTLLATWLSLVGFEEILRYAQNDRLKTTRDQETIETEGPKRGRVSDRDKRQ